MHIEVKYFLKMYFYFVLFNFYEKFQISSIPNIPRITLRCIYIRMSTIKPK